MNIIKVLDNLEIGMPIIVTTTYQNITTRKVTLYAGTNGMGTYNFVDDNGAYKITAGYIKDHVKIQTTLDNDEDLFELAKLIKEVKRG